MFLLSYVFCYSKWFLLVTQCCFTYDLFLQNVGFFQRDQPCSEAYIGFRTFQTTKVARKETQSLLVYFHLPPPKNKVRIQPNHGLMLNQICFIYTQRK